MKALQVAKEAADASSKQKEQKFRNELAAAEDARKTLLADKTALSEQVEAAKAEVNTVGERCRKAEEQVANAEAELRSTVLHLKEEIRVLKSGQEQRDAAEVAKVKAEHEAEVAKMQKIQYRLEKEVPLQSGLIVYEAQVFIFHYEILIVQASGAALLADG